MVLWQSPDTPVISGFHVSARLRVRSLICVHCFVLERGVRIPALMSWVSVSCGGSDTRAPRSVFFSGSVRSRVRSAAHSPVHVCFIVLHAVRVSIGCVHSCYILCCDGTQLVLFHWLCAFMSCVNTWLMSFLISCVFMSCFAHGWWIVCWPCACVFVLCEHVASVLIFCVPSALMSICLDPTHLVTCLLINFPQLFSLVTLLICSLYNLLVFAVLCWFVVVWCMPCVLSCPVSLVLPVQALFCLVQPASLFFPLRGCFCLFYFLLLIKSQFPSAIGSSFSSIRQKFWYSMLTWNFVYICLF